MPKKTIQIFSSYYLIVSIVFILILLISPTTKNGVGFIALGFAWPFVASFGLIYMKLFFLVPLVFGVIITSLLLQSAYLAQMLIKASEVKVEKVLRRTRNRLRTFVCLEALLFALIVITPAQHSFIPLSLGIWLLTALPGIYAVILLKNR